MKKIVFISFFFITGVLISSCSSSVPEKELRVGEIPPNKLIGNIREINQDEKYISVKISELNIVFPEADDLVIGDVVNIYFDEKYFLDSVSLEDIKDELSSYHVNEKVSLLYVNDSLHDIDSIYLRNLNLEKVKD